MRVLQVEHLIETQSQKYKERYISQYTRLLDSTPSFVTYYSIDGVNSTAELGTRDIMEYTGADSPIKYKKIESLPVYAIDAITAEITYDETSGAVTDYEDDALILSSTIKPYPGDHFIIPDFNQNIIFQVVDVKLRTLRDQDHYAVTYSVVSPSRIEDIENQVIETYKTIFRNIGTEDSVIIRESDYNALREFMESYRMLHERYVDEHYDEAIGYLKTPEWMSDILGHGTCKYLIKFLMDNRIMYFDEILETIFAFESVLPFKSNHNRIYNRSFPLLKFMKRKIPEGSMYVTFRGLPTSLFSDVYDEKIEQSIEFKAVKPDEDFQPDYRDVLLYEHSFIEAIQNKEYDELTPLEKVIAKFVNDEDITYDEYNEVIDDYESSDMFRFYFIPLVLLILKVRIKSLQTTRNK